MEKPENRECGDECGHFDETHEWTLLEALDDIPT